MLKTFLQHIAVVLCKKRLQKAANIPKIREFKILKIAKNGHQAKTLQNRHFGSKIENA